MSELNTPPSPEAVASFLKSIDFTPPEWYINLMSQIHEKIFDFKGGKYLHLWPLIEVAEIHEGYNTDEEYFPGFFLIGTYEVGEACAIEKKTSHIYTVPFIGDILEDTTYIGKKLEDLIYYLQEPW